MTPRHVRVFTATLAGVTGIQAAESGSLTTGLVFAAAAIAAAWAFAPLLLQLDLDEMYERQAGRDLGETEP